MEQGFTFTELGYQVLEVNSIWQMFFNCLFVSTLSLEFQREDGIILGPGTGRLGIWARAVGEGGSLGSIPGHRVSTSITAPPHRGLQGCLLAFRNGGSRSLQTRRNSVALCHLQEGPKPII